MRFNSILVSINAVINVKGKDKIMLPSNLCISMEELCIPIPFSMPFDVCLLPPNILFNSQGPLKLLLGLKFIFL